MRPAMAAKQASILRRKASLTPDSSWPRPAQEAAHVALLPVGLLRELEEQPHPREGRPFPVLEAGVEAGMHLRHVGVDDLQREVLLVLEVVVEGAFGNPRFREQGFDAQPVVAALQQHPEPRLDQVLLGLMGHPLVFSIRWSMTQVCSCWGLNMMRSASASTRTLCPGGQ